VIFETSTMTCPWVKAGAKTIEEKTSPVTMGVQRMSCSFQCRTHQPLCGWTENAITGSLEHPQEPIAKSQSTIQPDRLGAQGLQGRYSSSAAIEPALEFLSPSLENCHAVPNSRWRWASVALPSCGQACARSRSLRRNSSVACHRMRRPVLRQELRE
jgi:hypothetical protein